MNKTTCGPLFLRCLSTLTNLTNDPTLLFGVGHLTGQAEKIYLRACPAAMIRPSSEHRDFMFKAALHISEIYGLEVSVFERPEIADEIWIHRPEFRSMVSELSQLEFESAAWHYSRGLLCGIPLSDVDPLFHLREGYRQPCDIVGAKS